MGLKIYDWKTRPFPTSLMMVSQGQRCTKAEVIKIVFVFRGSPRNGLRWYLRI